MRTETVEGALYRVHHARLAPTEFDGPLYAAPDFDAALAETVLHDVPPGGDVPRAALRDRVLSRVAAPRPLRLLVRASRDGIAEPHADGLLWTSRHPPHGPAFMLFEDRVGALEVLEAPLPLDRGPGLELAEAAAMRAGVGLVF